MKLRKTVSAAVGRVLRRMIAAQSSRPLRRRIPLRRYRAAVVKLDRLGDAVLALGAIRTLVREYGERACLLVVSPQVEGLMRREFPAVDLVLLPAFVAHRTMWRNARKGRKALAGVQCDQVICLRHQRIDWDEVVLSWFGAGQTYFLNDDAGSSLSKGSQERLYRMRRGIEVNAGNILLLEKQQNRELARHRCLLEKVLGRSVSADEIRPGLSGRRTDKVQEGVVISPFASSTIRDYPVELLAATLVAVRRHTTHKVVLCAEKTREKESSEIALWIHQKTGIRIEIRTPQHLAEFLSVLEGAELIVTVDTATAHLATAMDARALILHGQGQPKEFVPWGDSSRQEWVSHDVACLGCNWQCIHAKPLCMTEVDLQTIFRAVEKVYAA